MHWPIGRSDDSHACRRAFPCPCSWAGAASLLLEGRSNRLGDDHRNPNPVPEVPQQEAPESVEKAEEERPVTRHIEKEVERVVDPTEPINPNLLVNQKEAPSLPAVAPENATGYADEHEEVVDEPFKIVTSNQEEEAPVTSTLAEVIDEELDSTTVALDREITAPILASVQPDSTLPPPRKPSINR